MLEFRNVSLIYDSKTIFSRLNFKIHSGEKILLKGPSGSGKSSILDLIMGFISPNEGELFWKLASYSQLQIQTIRRDLAWVPQNLKLFSSGSTISGIQSIFDNKLNKSNQPEISKIYTLAKELNLAEEQLRNDYTSLSGGESQRIAIICSLLLNRELSLMDEPTSALDNTTAQKAMKLILNNTKTLLCISHSSEFDNLFDWIIYIGGENGN